MVQNFDFSTHYQADYFEAIGRMVAQKNSKKVLNKRTKNKHNLLGVVINKSYGFATIKHCVEISWLVKDDYIEEVEYVLALYKKTVVGVFKFNKKHEIEPGTNRKILSIEMAEIEVQYKYLGAKVNANPRTTVYLEEI